MMLDGDELMQFHAAELLEAHSHMDKLGIPSRDEDGEKLSISQRTKLVLLYVQSLVQANAVMQRMRA